jgi:demethylmenaquinone methyltransferase/2-methoxy-6-polyprenyl-1,4-benzoquinol methylase
VKAYYHARAREYDDWWLGRGLYAGRQRPGWEEDLEALFAALGRLPAVRTLDVACGTGFVTQHLPGEVVGLDQSDAMLEVARGRVPGTDFVVGDALALPFPSRSFDRAFTSYFYCHLEQAERLRFLAEARRVAPELVVVGSRVGEGDARERWEERVLQDGTRWQVFKRVFEPDELAEELSGRVLHAGDWFVAVASP